MQDDPSALADDPAVIDDPRVLGADGVVADGRGGRRAARDPTAKEQRHDQAGVHESRREANARQPARCRESLAIRPIPPARELDRVEWLRNEPQELGLAGGRIARRGQPFQVQRPVRDRDHRLAQGRSLEELATLDIGARGHGEEQLGMGEPQQRLVPLEQLEIDRPVRHARSP